MGRERTEENQQRNRFRNELENEQLPIRIRYLAATTFCPENGNSMSICNLPMSA
jgi:hypothetical protein